MNIKHIVFDWDGTLADTYPVISAAYAYVFKTLNLPPIPYEKIKEITSTLQNKDTLGYLFNERKTEAETAYYDYINRHHVSDLKAMPSALETLEFCRNKGLNLYLLTNKKREFLLAEAQKLGFSEFFKKIGTAGDFSEDKPHPLATHALFDNVLPKADTIMVVGDGLADWKTARSYDSKNAKAVCTICNPNLKITEDTPDFQISDLKELISILQNQSE